jgi:hypothetical protein
MDQLTLALVACARAGHTAALRPARADCVCTPMMRARGRVALSRIGFVRLPPEVSPVVTALARLWHGSGTALARLWHGSGTLLRGVSPVAGFIAGCRGIVAVWNCPCGRKHLFGVRSSGPGWARAREGPPTALHCPRGRLPWPRPASRRAGRPTQTTGTRPPPSAHTIARPIGRRRSFADGTGRPGQPVAPRADSAPNDPGLSTRPGRAARMQAAGAVCGAGPAAGRRLELRFRLHRPHALAHALLLELPASPSARRRARPARLAHGSRDVAATLRLTHDATPAHGAQAAAIPLARAGGFRNVGASESAAAASGEPRRAGQGGRDAERQLHSLTA